MPGVAFFVCGTPSNNRGFELVELGPERLPGIPAAYLDKAPADAAECHRIEALVIDRQRYVQYSRVLRINPNDAEANRGAYVAVGCLMRERLALHTVSNCLDLVSELYGRVCSGLTTDRSFPTGYRLADFQSDGAPLEEKTAYPCSPLLVADVVLQALNAEGPLDWTNAREVLLAPEEMTAADVGRLQLYSRQGQLGSLASLDMDRARVQQTAQRAAAAAQALVELQREWAALEGSAEGLLAKGQAFQNLTLELERGAKRDVALDAATLPHGRSAPKQALGGKTALYEREQRAASAFGIRAQRARGGHEAALRRQNPQKHASRVPGTGWPRVLALVLVGSLVAAGAIFAAQFLPGVGVEPAPTQAVVQPPPPQGSEQEPAQPESDVARERAALDASPND